MCQLINQGNVHNLTLKKSMSDNFFKKNYPKSLDRNYFSIKNYKMSKSIGKVSQIIGPVVDEGIKKIDLDCRFIYLMGGGSRNLFILKELIN